jgi:hypothetical protein
MLGLTLLLSVVAVFIVIIVGSRPFLPFFIGMRHLSVAFFFPFTPSSGSGWLSTPWCRSCTNHILQKERLSLCDFVLITRSKPIAVRD